MYMVHAGICHQPTFKYHSFGEEIQKDREENHGQAEEDHGLHHTVCMSLVLHNSKNIKKSILSIMASGLNLLSLRVVNNINPANIHLFFHE